MRIGTLLLPFFLLVAVPLFVPPCAAQTASPRLQDAGIHASGSTLTITRLPIHTSTGVIYRDVTIELHVDDSGNVTLNTDRSGHALVKGMPGGAPAGKVTLSAPAGAIQLAQRPSAPLVLQHFVAGTYEAPGSPLVKLTQKDPESLHGLPTWSLTTIGDADGPVERATWYSGPPSLNPVAHRLEEAGIDGADYAYGTAASGATMTWGGGALIGVSQQGNVLKLVSFRRGCCSASAQPTSTLVFTRVGH
jgi:hypothetical protein